jgi:arachidonate 5-lipoxygenase
MLSNGPVPVLTPIDQLQIAPRRPTEAAASFRWENLAFEGGGAKGFAYIGALRELEEAGIYPDAVRRVAGTSVGALMAMFAVLGVSSDYMLRKTPRDLKALVMDASGGRLGSFYHAMRTRGLHPGARAYTFLGDVLAEVAGSPDITFQQVHERFGRELCVPVTNVTRMMTEYCHPKTTPKMAVRVAVRMSMSLPVLLEPVWFSKAAGGESPAEVYVDGGLLCNNPTHVFDGWWLSMAAEDSFLRRLRPLDRAHEHYARSARFSPSNANTLGFTLFAAEESDITRSWVRPGGGPPGRPNTNAAQRFAEQEAGESSGKRMAIPLQKLLDALDSADRSSPGTITRDELSDALIGGQLSPSELSDAFGSINVDEIFAHLDEDKSGVMDFGELLAFLESRGVDTTTQLVGFAARQPRSTAEFALNLLEAVSRDLTRANHDADDRARTVGINTDYIGTQSFELEEGDYEFLLATGRLATRAFLNDSGPAPG